MNEENNRTVDFESIKSMAYSVPLSFRFFRKQAKEADTWKDLYFLVMKELAHSFPECFAPEKNTVLPAGELGNLQAAKAMKKPMPVRRGIYIETDLGTETMMRRIRDTLVLCGVPFEHLTITYTIDEERKRQQEERRLLAEQQPKVYTLAWHLPVSHNGAVPLSYKYKNKRTKQMTSWSAIYVELLSDLLREYPKKIKHGLRAKGRRSPDIVGFTRQNDFRRPQRLGKKLLLETYGGPDALVGRMYYFLDYCDVAPEQVIIKFGFDDTQREQEYIAAVAEKETTSATTDVDNKIIRRCRQLLKKYFPEGYRIDSPDDMSRLRQRYQAGYKEALLLDDAQVKEALRFIAPVLDGKIFAQKSDEQDAVLDEILQLISDTFDQGASCIYLQPLFERYREALAAHANVYSPNALGDFLLTKLDKAYSLKQNHLYFGRRKISPEDELLAEMRQHNQLVPAADLYARFWYISSDRLGQILSDSDEIVAAGYGMYYCASNLPLTRKQLGNIKKEMHKQLALQDALSEIEVLQLVLQERPQLLGEVPHLTLAGLWKSLCFLLNDTMIYKDGRLRERGSIPR